MLWAQSYSQGVLSLMQGSHRDEFENLNTHMPGHWFSVRTRITQMHCVCPHLPSAPAPPSPQMQAGCAGLRRWPGSAQTLYAPWRPATFLTAPA
eukprot:scaffold96974_cov18-Tisochrysis_lutea.AAC.1